jgi:RNA recognition motif-containing protein
MSREGQVYVGKLNERLRERDLEETFAKYGKINRVSLKVGFGFVVSIAIISIYHFLLSSIVLLIVIQNQQQIYFTQEFDDARDADDAIRALDGKELEGNRIIVERSTGGRRNEKDRGRVDRGRGRYLTHLVVGH